MDKKKSLIVFVFCFFLLLGASFVLPENFSFDINNILNSETFLNPFLAFIPTNFPVEKSEPVAEFFAETTENLDNETEEVIPEEIEITETLEEMTGVGGPENPQEILDDIAEKFDIIKQKALVLIEEYTLKNNLEQKKEDDKLKLEVEELEQEEEEKAEEEKDDNDFEIQKPKPKVKTPQVPSGGSRPIYPKILISEVKIAPVGERFVELYNPNNEAMNLTGWYLQRKTENITSETAWNSFVSSPRFEGKIIPVGDYFLISREIVGSDILLDITLSDNNSLALKNPNGEISDKVGFGSSQNFETSPAQNPDESQSLGRIFDEASQTYLDTDNNSVDFELNTPTPKAKNNVYVVTPPLPPPPPPPVEEDNTAPEITFILDALQTSLTFSINFEITDVLGTVTPSGISSYIFQWQEEGGIWQEDSEVSPSDSPIIITGTREFTGQDEKTYYFRIKAKDTAGNESVWLPEIPISTKISISKKVLINEIQIEGETVKDEFIELYNPNSVDINLFGFELKKKTSGGIESNLVSSGKFLGIIKTMGFLLIVPQKNDDDTENYTGIATPDLRYSGETFSIASDNTILFYDSNNILLDKVGFGTAKDFEMASALNPGKGQSIVRKELGVDTDDNSQDFTISDAPTPQGSLFLEP